MISKTFHYVYIYNEATPMPLDINHYICIASQIIVNKPLKVVIHTNNYEQFFEFPWMSKLMSDFGNIIQIDCIDRVTNYQGNKITSPIQESDIYRFSLLRDWGGCYADMDVLAVSPIPKEMWESNKCIQGLEPWENKFLAPRALGSAFIMSPKKEKPSDIHWMDVVLKPYENYDKEIKKGRFELPIFNPYRQALKNPELVDIKQPEVFFPLYFYYEDCARLFLNDWFAQVSENTLQIHLWENRTRGLIKYCNTEYFKTSNATYAQLVRRLNIDL